MTTRTPPVLIGIAGPSCSGKSSIAAALAHALPGEVVVLPIDHYYHDLAQLEPAERFRFNFDIPTAIDLDLLLGNLRDLARGVTITRPVYLFPEHVRADEGERLDPPDFVVVEGLFALYWREIRTLLTSRVFVAALDEVCLTRRLERDVRERGRTPESVREQYEQTVRPMCERHVEPTRKHADLVVDGLAPVAESTRRVLALLPPTGVLPAEAQ